MRVQEVQNWWGTSIHIIQNGVSVGHIKVSIENTSLRVATISDLVVVESGRRKGCAKKLLKRALEECHRKGIQAVHIAAEKNSIADKWYASIATFFDEDEHLNYYLILLK